LPKTSLVPPIIIEPNPENWSNLDNDKASYFVMKVLILAHHIANNPNKRCLFSSGDLLAQLQCHSSPH